MGKKVFEPRKYLTEENKNATKRKYSQRQEKRVAEDLGGRVVTGSGCSDYAKGDVITRDYIVECKRTDLGSMQLKGDWLVKIEHEAMAKEKKPMLVIEISGVTDRMATEWACIPMKHMQKLLDIIENGEE